MCSYLYLSLLGTVLLLFIVCFSPVFLTLFKLGLFKCKTFSSLKPLKNLHYDSSYLLLTSFIYLILPVPCPFLPLTLYPHPSSKY